MKRLFSISLVVLLVTIIFTTAFADSGIAPYASQVIDDTTVVVSFSNGRVEGTGYIRTVSPADKLGVSAIALYEKNGSGWTKIASASGKYKYNAKTHSYVISAPATKGKEYKVTATLYGKIGSLTDSHTQSQIATY